MTDPADASSPSLPARLLIVEDHELVRKSYERVFRFESGIEIGWMAGTGQEALDVLSAATPDLAVVDLALPDIDGFQVVKACRDGTPPVLALVVSGRNEGPSVDRALAAGAAGYVLKGDTEQILRGVRAVLSGETYVSPELRGAP
jgi:DNA-binding NarL/FixJ family response regulator